MRGRPRVSLMASILTAMASLGAAPTPLTPKDEEPSREKPLPKERQIRRRPKWHGKRPQRQGPAHLIEARAEAASAKRQRRRVRNARNAAFGGYR